MVSEQVDTQNPREASAWVKALRVARGGSICDQAKVPRVTAHAMRGLLATISAERGLAGHLIAATLGHEDERTTFTAYAAPGAAETGSRRAGLVVLAGGRR